MIDDTIFIKLTILACIFDGMYLQFVEMNQYLTGRKHIAQLLIFPDIAVHFYDTFLRHGK